MKNIISLSLLNISTLYLVSSNVVLKFALNVPLLADFVVKV